MAKKKKKSPDLSLDQLKAQAAEHLAGGKHQQAIVRYKELHKRDPQGEWRPALLQCYRGRANGLAGKGMYNEAALLWLQQILGDRPALADQSQYIIWLLKADKNVTAATYYSKHYEALSQCDANNQLAGLFAAQVMADQGELLSHFPPESAISTDGELANQALSAYCDQQDEAARSTLKQIPFRSPYRDFALLLKALLLDDKQEDKTHSLFNKIPPDSAFAPFARRLANQAKLGSAGIEVEAELLGWSKEQLQLARKMAAFTKQPSAKQALEFILAHKHLLPLAQVKRACLALILDYPDGWKRFNKELAPLTKFDLLRLGGIANEQANDHEGAIEYWGEAVDAFIKEAPEQKLAIALLYRHHAGLIRSVGDPGEIGNEYQALSLSIEYDPQVKSAYLRLAELSQQQKDTRGLQSWVNKGMAEFPQDRELLELAIAAASGKKAYKTATRFAGQLLVIDPINVKAKQCLVVAHLAHGRKLANQGKFALAEKELAAAHEVGVKGEQGAHILALQALLQERQKQAVSPALLDQAGQWLNNPVLLNLIVLSEAYQLGVRSKSGLQKLSKTLLFVTPAACYQAAKGKGGEHLLELTRHAAASHQLGMDGVSEVISLLNTPIMAMAKQQPGEKTLLKVLENLAQCLASDQLARLGKHAVKRFYSNAEFHYYKEFGEMELDTRQADSQCIARIHYALDLALSTKNDKAIFLLSHLLEQIDNLYEGPFQNQESDFDEMPDIFSGMDTLDLNALETLTKELGALPVAEREALLENLLNEIGPDIFANPNSRGKGRK